MTNTDEPTVTTDRSTFVELCNVAAVPNPDDWTDTSGAADMIGRDRSTVYDLVARDVLTAYRIGRSRAYWVPEVREVAAALARLRRG
jgi:hypothetical protein